MAVVAYALAPSHAGHSFLFRDNAPASKTHKKLRRSKDESVLDALHYRERPIWG